MLFGSYLSGLMLTYISQPDIPAGSSDADYPTPVSDTELGSEHRAKSLSFEETFTRLLGPVQEYVLLPLFFASIGFAIVSPSDPLMSLTASDGMLIPLPNP